MIQKIKNTLANRKRRSLVQELVDLEATRQAIARRERYIEHLIKSMDTLAVRNEVAAIRARGY